MEPMSSARRPDAKAAPAYSIRVVSKMTGIEPETLRMWERRYDFPKPERTEGGNRLYSEHDVEALNLVVRAMRDGYRPGEIVGKSIAELTRIVSRSAAPEPVTTPPSLDEAFAALEKDDVVRLRAILRQAAVLLGPSRFVTDVAHPAAVRAGQLWEAGKLDIRHEHVLSEALSAQLHLLAGSLEEPAGGPVVLLATLPGELHALGLDLVAVYLAANRVSTRIVGPDTPTDQIAQGARAYHADVVGLGVSAAADPKQVRRDVRALLEDLPRRVPVWLGGAGAAKVGLDDPSVVPVGDWAALDAAIARLAHR